MLPRVRKEHIAGVFSGVSANLASGARGPQAPESNPISSFGGAAPLQTPRFADTSYSNAQID